MPQHPIDTIDRLAYFDNASMAFNHDGIGPGVGLLAPGLLEPGKR